MSDNNDSSNDGGNKSETENSEPQRREFSEALGEGIIQKSGEATDEDDRPNTTDYDDGYIPTRFRAEGRSTGERRARERNDSSDE